MVKTSSLHSSSPNVGGVVGLADLYVDPALGFSLGWAAWVSVFSEPGQAVRADILVV